MIEPITLGLIAAGLASGALGRIEDGVLDAGEEAMRKVLAALRRRFAETDDEEGIKALERLAEAPGQSASARELATRIDEQVQGSPEFGLELKDLVGEAREAGVRVDSAAQIAIGEQNVQVSGVVDSQVNVRQGSPPRSDS